MPTLRVTEPLYQKTPQGGVKKVGYQICEITTKANGDIIKSQIIKSKIYK